VLQRLLDEGYEVEVRQQHLLVHSVPYVAEDGTLATGTLICKYIEDGGTILPPRPPGDNHQVWWTGRFPCRADKRPMVELVADTKPQTITVFEGCTARHQFSNKPEQWSAEGFPDHYEKITHYVTLIQSQARVIDPDASAQTKRVIEAVDADSVFRYADTASVRAEIVASTAKLRQRKVAIVGLGGTGSYVFDQVAKTPVWEVHLFDGDRFKQHNAFRAPGAATREHLRSKLLKVDYFFQLYDPMRKGIFPHPYFLTTKNVAELACFDFVFVCVDDGGSRRTVCEYLTASAVSFIDVGMDVVQNKETLELDGTCRVTTITAGKNGHLARSIPMDQDNDDAIYRQNIQVADLNALNAQLAVIKWKQLLGFYEDVARSNHTAYTVATQSLTRGERGNVGNENAA
jgi:hypothetical protein